MPDIPAISESEWDVMNVLWEADGPLTAEQVVAALAAVRDWSPRTVKTLLNRLINKRALAFEQQGKRYLYRPNVSREQCVRHESRSFLSRVFNGSAGPLLVHFVKQARLSPQEIEELKRLLDHKGK